MRGLFLTLLLLAPPPATANVAGRWALNFVYRDGTHTQGYCSFSQDGPKLTGLCGPDTTGGSRLTGEIANNEISWRVEDGPAYQATLDERGTFMRGSFSLAGEGVFTAMKTR